MRIEVVGKNGFNPSDANKEYAAKKLEKLKNHLSDYDNLTARVVCKVYNSYHKVEVTIPSKTIILRAEESNEDIYAAIDEVVDKLVKQIRRHNDKIKNKLGKSSIRTSGVLEEKDEPTLVKNKTIDLEPMTKEEAIDQMELLGHDFFVYLDKQTRKTNVIYIRDDGNYAVIETNKK